MRGSLILSTALHIGIFLLVIFGLPPSDRRLEMAQSIPVELVNMGDITEPAKVDEGEESPDPPAPPPPPAGKPTPTPPMPEKVETAPPPPPKIPEPPKLAQLPPPPREPQPAPQPPKPPEPPKPPPAPTPAPTPDPVPEPPKKEPPKPEPPKPEPPKPEPPKKEPPKPEPPKPEQPKPEPPKKEEPKKEEPKKPEPAKPAPPKKEEPKKPVDPLASILGAADSLKKEAKPSTSTSTKPSGAKRAADGPERPFKPSGRAEDALRSQVSKNWNFDPGRRDAASMVIGVRIYVNRDHSVARAELESQYLSRYNSDRAYRAAADSAIRAILRSSPLNLLPEEFTDRNYEDWRTIVFTFDPRDMF